MDRSMGNHDNAPEIFEAMDQIAADAGCSGIITVDQAGAALNGAWVTQFSPAVYFKFPKAAKGGGSLWDFAASASVLEEWGQPATDIFGKPLDLNPPGSTFMNEGGVLFASSRSLGRDVLACTRRTS